MKLYKQIGARDKAHFEVSGQMGKPDLFTRILDLEIK
jgi:hypothetical protein